MDGWEKVIAIVIPLVMNWLEVRGLRREMRETHHKHDERFLKLETRMDAYEQVAVMR